MEGVALGSVVLLEKLWARIPPEGQLAKLVSTTEKDPLFVDELLRKQPQSRLTLQQYERSGGDGPCKSSVPGLRAHANLHEKGRRAGQVSG